jgi:uncharacterized membrane protein YfcA
LIPPIGLPAAWRYYSEGTIRLEAALWIAAAFALGAYAGAWLVNYFEVGDLTLRLTFGLVMIFVAIRFIVYSDAETVNVAAGLISTAGAWCLYLGLRLLGRRHLPRPDLGEHIRQKQKQGWGETEYHI